MNCHVLVQCSFGYRKCSASRCVRLCHAWGQISSGESVRAFGSFCTFEWWICFFSFLLRHAFFVFCCWWAASKGGWVWLLPSTREWLCPALILQAQCYASTRPDKTNAIVESKSLHSYGFGTEKKKQIVNLGLQFIYKNNRNTMCNIHKQKDNQEKNIFCHDPEGSQTVWW